MTVVIDGPAWNQVGMGRGRRDAARRVAETLESMSTEGITP